MYSPVKIINHNIWDGKGFLSLNNGGMKQFPEGDGGCGGDV